MTDYEIDPDGVLVDGAYVRAGDIEGTWAAWRGSKYAGYVGHVGVPRGMEQHIHILRPAVNRIPTEPGTYTVTWEDGSKSTLNPYTVWASGAITDASKTGHRYQPDSDLRRATWTRIDPDWFPPQPGDAALLDGLLHQFRGHGQWICVELVSSPALPFPRYRKTDEMRNAELLARNKKKWKS